MTLSAGRYVAALLVGLALCLAASSARCDPRPVVQHHAAPLQCTTATGRAVVLEPGYAVPEPAWSALDAELRRLQTAEVRLAAENASLRASVSAGPGWGTLAAVVGALAAGTAAAWFGYHR